MVTIDLQLSAELPSTAPLLAAGIALAVAALFAGVDTALTALSRARLDALGRMTRPLFRSSVERAVRQRPGVQARYLAGRMSALIVASACFSWWLAKQPIDTTGLLARAGIGLLLAGLLIQASVSFGRVRADWLVPPALFLLAPLELLMLPLQLSTSWLGKLVVRKRAGDPQVTETEVELMVDQGERSGMLKQEPAEMIRNILDFSDLTARDAMVPRAHVVAIKGDTPIEETLAIIMESGHSRYPVYGVELDDLIGILYAKDLFRLIEAPELGSSGDGLRNPTGDSAPPSVRAARLVDIVRRNPKMVPRSQSLPSLLRLMRQNHEHLAMVVDEFGEICGIVTLEDLLEEIVGDIQDEHDVEETPIVPIGRGRVMADAAVLVAELSSYLGSDLDPEGHYDSLGGMLTDKLGAVPQEGTSFGEQGMRFIVRESDEKHITKVEIVFGPDRSGSFSAVS